jgi:hypothetical protein
MHPTTSNISYFRYDWLTLHEVFLFSLYLLFMSCSMCHPVAERISAERGESIGDTVGYKVLTDCYNFQWCIYGISKFGPSSFGCVGAQLWCNTPVKNVPSSTLPLFLGPLFWIEVVIWESPLVSTFRSTLFLDYICFLLLFVLIVVHNMS